MSEWRGETASDLAEASTEIEAASKSISGEPSDSQLMSVWRAYVKVEKSIAFIKIELDEDLPGRFVEKKRYAVPDERQALQFALHNLRKGADDFAVGDLRQALKGLRDCRNYLRVLLRTKRLKRWRAVRGT